MGSQSFHVAELFMINTINLKYHLWTFFNYYKIISSFLTNLFFKKKIFSHTTPILYFFPKIIIFLMIKEKVRGSWHSDPQHQPGPPK